MKIFIWLFKNLWLLINLHAGIRKDGESVVCTTILGCKFNTKIFVHKVNRLHTGASLHMYLHKQFLQNVFLNIPIGMKCATHI